jgi:hypothetical protein
MNGTFPGRIVLVEGDEVDVDLQLAKDKVRLATPFAEIGLWDRDSIQFEPNRSGGYELSVADDVVTFYPADLDAFADAVDDSPPDIEIPALDSPSRSPISLVPGLPSEDIESDVSIEEESAGEATAPIAFVDDEVASRFGPSSRERLAAAMSTFRERQEEETGDDQDSIEEVERRSSTGFVIPGDAGYAYPTEDAAPIDFAEEVGESTVADDILASQRSLRGASSMGFNPAILKKVGLGVVALAVLAGLVFAVPIVLDFLGGGDQPAPDTVTQATVPVAAPPVTSVEPPPVTVVDSTTEADPSAFEISSNAFVERWNDTASLVSPNLRFRSSLPAGDFEVGFTQHIAMIGTSGSGDAGLAAFTVEVDPTGPSASDQLGIQALGLAIAVVDPTLEPSERGMILAEMGLNVRDPQLQGLDGTTTRNGIDYRLVFDSEDVMLRLTVSPGA